MTDIVILAEEPSGQVIAECLAQKLGLFDRTILLAHQGKSDLDRSFLLKIGHWRAQKPPKFIIMRDNDGADCLKLKGRLIDRIPSEAIRRVKVRLVVQELESWYLGDLSAVVKAGFATDALVDPQRRKAKLKNPDRLNNAKQVFRGLVTRSGEIALARGIGPHLSLTENRSPSFHHFVGALRWAAG
jgi:hypothetical protein